MDNIRTNFIRLVTTETINTMKTEMDEADLNLSDMGSLKDTLTQMNDDIIKLKQFISDEKKDSENYQTFINECSVKLPKVSEQISSLQKIIP